MPVVVLSCIQAVVCDQLETLTAIGWVSCSDRYNILGHVVIKSNLALQPVVFSQWC